MQRKKCFFIILLINEELCQHGEFAIGTRFQFKNERNFDSDEKRNTHRPQATPMNDIISIKAPRKVWKVFLTT